MNQVMFLTPIKEIVSSSLMYDVDVECEAYCIGCWKPPCTAQCIFVSSDHEEDVSHLGSGTLTGIKLDDVYFYVF